MRYPEIIYKALPYLYLSAGAKTLTTLDHPLEIVSALLFVSAGLLVLKWRHLDVN